MRLAAVILLGTALPALASETWPFPPDEPGEGRVALGWSGYGGVDLDTVSLSLRQAAGRETSLGVDASSIGDGDWSASAVVRQDLSNVIQIDGVSILAGVGASETGEDRRATLRLGGQIARGLDSDSRLGGWLSLDAEARVSDTERTEFAGSTQLGVTAFDRVSLSGGIEITGTTEDETLATRLSSSLVGHVGDNAHVAVGASVGLERDAPAGIHIGTWLEF